MENTLKVPDLNGTKKSTGEKSSLATKEIAGKITSHIGTGNNAKDSFIWMTITRSFYIATTISVLLFIRSFFNVAAEENLLDSIVKIWGVFVPIITLALGYAFGKGR
jgi:hypothetical protein